MSKSTAKKKEKEDFTSQVIVTKKERTQNNKYDRRRY
jgi:hypothetical protein